MDRQQEVSARELGKRYRPIIDEVRKTKKARLIAIEGKPVAAIVSLETLQKAIAWDKEQEELVKNQSILKLIGIIPKDSKIPSNLAAQHDKYTWE